MVDLRIISYNLRKHAAIGELTELAVSNDVDVMCLQECDTDDLADSVAHLQLIDATSTNRLGLALYARADRYTVQDTKMFSMHRSLHDRVLSPRTSACSRRACTTRRSATTCSSARSTPPR
ncbi:endonuclease/exonuclease/phosphatase family protein [Agromyces mangrovi Wang et al. 2018]|uniref:endonuclease/exonuclease/phosphatase family protein n=1 Tax=Agromyces mangrovi TaxID=1858653 RepID=UPI00330614DB|nr:hypothetical protein GCM10025877_31070 [Agromyces mangrovi]